jgi:virginiamycin B lyase
MAGDVTTFAGSGINEPGGLTLGPDGALWFTNQRDNTIGRITIAGTVTDYTGPGIDQVRGSMVVGPDRALWFTNWTRSGSIGRITTSGIVTNYTDPTINFPYGIIAGADGALWFTNRNNSIGRITT